MLKLKAVSKNASGGSKLITWPQTFIWSPKIYHCFISSISQVLIILHLKELLTILITLHPDALSSFFKLRSHIRHCAIWHYGRWYKSRQGRACANRKDILPPENFVRKILKLFSLRISICLTNSFHLSVNFNKEEEMRDPNCAGAFKLKNSLNKKCFSNFIFISDLQTVN